MAGFDPYEPLSETNVLSVRPLGLSVSRAPVFTKHRLVKVNPDSAAVDNVHRGMNMSGYDKAHVKVIPSSGITPTVEILFWSETAGKFISEQTAISKAGPGAGLAFEFTVDVQGRIIFAYVTGTIGADKQVEVEVAGVDLDRES